jgi:hypothetical protein
MGDHHLGKNIFLAMSFVFLLTTVIVPAEGIANQITSDVPNVRIYKGIEDHPNYVRNRWPSDAPGIRVYRGLSDKTPFTPPSQPSDVQDSKQAKLGSDGRRRVATYFPNRQYLRDSLKKRTLIDTLPSGFEKRAIIRTLPTGFKKRTLIKTHLWSVYSKSLRFREYRIPPHLRVGFRERTLIKTKPIGFKTRTLIRTLPTGFKTRTLIKTHCAPC